jgi:hypothetical protein
VKRYLRENWAKLLTRVIITVMAVVGIWLHLSNKVKLDLPTVCLMALGLLPWLAAVIKSLELPGGFKVELRETRTIAKEALSKSEEAKGTAEAAQTRSRNEEKLRELAFRTHKSSFHAPGTEEIASGVRRLVADYLKIRDSLQRGPRRTELMEDKVAEMIALAREYPDFDWKYHLMLPDKGWRLFAYAYLFAHPSFDRLDVCARSAWTFRTQSQPNDNQPFGEYWSIRAMQALAKQAFSEEGRSCTVSPETAAILLEHYRHLPRGTDRHYEMGRLLEMLELP